MKLKASPRLRIALFSVVGAVALSAVMFASPVVAQGVKEFMVRLQDTSPGTTQTGNVHISGTMMAGTFAGSGSGLTNVPWSSITGAPTTLLSLPYSGELTSSNTGFFLWNHGSGLAGNFWSNGTAVAGQGGFAGGNFLSSHASGAGVYGQNSSPTGNAWGGYFTSTSDGGRGIYSRAISPTGYTYGGEFYAESENGTGIWAEAKNSAGNGTGGVFMSHAPSGFGVWIANSAITGPAIGGYFRSDSTNGSAILAEASATSGNTIGGDFKNYGSSGLAIGVKGSALPAAGSNNASFGGYFVSTAQNSGRGVYALTTGTGGNNYGGWFEANGGYGVYAQSSGSYGGYFVNDSSSGTGLFAHQSAASGNAIAGEFRSESTSGKAIVSRNISTSGTTRAIECSVISPSGIAVHSIAGATTGGSIAGYFEARGPTSNAIEGYATSATGSTRAGMFTADSSSATVVYGFATSTAGTAWGLYGVSNAASGIGVRGLVSNTTNVVYGVYGAEISSNAGAYGVFASGNLGASGTKSFRIDHPFDPENKYLLHYSSESPFPQNFYNGNVVTDANGYAVVTLPDYFAEINTNFKYTLTVVDESDSDTFVMAKVVKKIKGNQFTIRTNYPSVEVSWRVDADRNDAWVRTMKPKDVLDKEGPERGTYQHPELYGQPEEKRLHHGVNGTNATTATSRGR